MFAQCVSSPETLNAHIMQMQMQIQYRTLCTPRSPFPIRMARAKMLYLPAFPRQLSHTARNVSEALFKPCPPPLRCQPFPLQPPSFMVSLPHEVVLDPISCYQTTQHTDSSYDIPPTLCIQLHRTAVRGVQAGVPGECLFLLGSERDGIRWLISKRRIHNFIRHCSH